MDSPYPLERSVLASSSQLSSFARSFASLGFNYTDSSHFISENPAILTKSEVDALIVEALVAEKAGQSDMSQIYVHQALLLRKCAELGPKDINSFFQALSAKDGRAKESFIKDVKKVYSAIQRQAEKDSPQNQAHSSEAPTRKLPVVSHPIEATTATESFHRPTVSTPPGPLPTLHEHRKLEPTSITGGSGMEERLDHRE
jgi:hypothetical protein